MAHPDIRRPENYQHHGENMNITYVLTVFREKGTALQHHNYDDLVQAMRKADQLKSERWVAKVELSVIIHTWRR